MKPSGSRLEPIELPANVLIAGQPVLITGRSCLIRHQFGSPPSRRVLRDPQHRGVTEHQTLLLLDIGINMMGAAAIASLAGQPRSRLPMTGIAPVIACRQNRSSHRSGHTPMATAPSTCGMF